MSDMYETQITYTGLYRTLRDTGETVAEVSAAKLFEIGEVPTEQLLALRQLSREQLQVLGALSPERIQELGRLSPEQLQKFGQDEKSDVSMQPTVQAAVASVKPRKPKKRIGEFTDVAWDAFGAYLRAHPKFKPGTKLAKSVIGLATRIGIANAEGLDEHGAFGIMMTALLRGFNRPTTPLRTRKAPANTG